MSTIWVTKNKQICAHHTCMYHTNDLNDCELVRTRVILFWYFFLVWLMFGLLLLLPLLSISFVNVLFLLSFIFILYVIRMNEKHTHIQTHKHKIDIRRKWYYVIVEEMMINCECMKM